MKTAAVLDVRSEFPALSLRIRGRPLAYLDNAATTQKPREVLEAIQAYYAESNANVHRGVHTLSQRATDLFEGAREEARSFLKASAPEEIVFVRGTTEGINLVARSFPHLRPGDEVVITAMEHHSNIVPWQMICGDAGARLRVAPIDDHGQVDLEVYGSLLGPRVRMVSIAHVSNALGTVNPVAQMVAMAHREGIPVLVDGAQAAPHVPVDVTALDCDFYAFSGHKVYGPTGIGVLYGRRRLLEEIPPWQGGGDMILSVTFEHTTYNKIPWKFEAGTPDIAGAVGLAAALRWVRRVGRDAIAAHESDLLDYATRRVREVPGLRLIGTAAEKAAVLSFVMDGAHAHDIGTVLDEEGIAVRTGHHCAQPVMERFGVPATARASFAAYNTREEVDRLVEGLHRVREIFR